jgi:large conductance mechanosensitive channel
VVDLAVGIVIGAAFGTVVSSLVKNILTPLLAIPGTVNFADLRAEVGGADILYGIFLNDLIAFLTIAVGVFFFVVRPINALMARRRTEPEVASTTRSCPHCVSSIPVDASVCAFCTRDVGSVV